MDLVYVVCDSEVIYAALSHLFGSSLTPQRFDDGKVIAAIRPMQLTRLFMWDRPGMTRLPAFTVPLSETQIAALPYALRRRLGEKVFMRDVLDAVDADFPNGALTRRAP